MPLEVGPTFAGYTIVRRIGAGGMGEVYLAQHPRLPRSDALKLLGGHVSADSSFRERFLREADLAATLFHPHIVGVHDRGEYEDQLWISMDFVDGDDAGSLMSRRYPTGMPRPLVVAIVKAVGSALDYAHKQGLLHRDVKPANILLTHVDDEDQRRILLTDFGIARTVDDVSGLTATNMTIGTVAYTAPEQLMGEDVDGRVDQYSLAATAYHLLTGAPPFRDSNPAVVIGRHLNTGPPALSDTRPDLASLDRVLATALAKDRNARFTNCSAFARALAAPAADVAAFAAPPTAAAPTPPPFASPDAATQYAHSQPSSPHAPGWYLDPSGRPGTAYWDGQAWHPAPTQNARMPASAAMSQRGGDRPQSLLWVLGIVVAIVVVGSLVFLWSQVKKSSPSSASTSDIAADARAPAVPRPYEPPPVAYPPVAAPPQPSVYAPTAVIVGTCDEGGSCGVKQRTGPYTSAPRLYPNDLQDGATVTLSCQITGDVRSSAGHGSSSVWYRLDNGAYVNSVYMDRTPGIPAC